MALSPDRARQIIEAHKLSVQRFVNATRDAIDAQAGRLFEAGTYDSFYDALADTGREQIEAHQERAIQLGMTFSERMYGQAQRPQPVHMVPQIEDAILRMREAARHSQAMVAINVERMRESGMEPGAIRQWQQQEFRGRGRDWTIYVTGVKNAVASALLGLVRVTEVAAFRGKDGRGV